MSLENLSKEEIEEKFEIFLFNISDSIEQIEDKANQQNLKFDYTLNSLRNIEIYILKNNTTITDDDYNDLSAYLGEVLRQNSKGKWICNLDKEGNSLYYGFPVITGHSIDGVLFSPFHLIKAFILRKKENLFKDAIDSQVNPKEIDWSGYPNEE
jgi:hypothetical protein